MKKLFKNKYLYFIPALFLGLAAAAAEVPAEGRRATPEERMAQHEARYTQWCAANAERCKAMQARLQQRMAECKADPEKCRAQRQARFEQRFKLADADGDGMISRAEAEKALPRMARHFERFDMNQDGQVTREEIMALRKARFEQRRRAAERPNI